MKRQTVAKSSLSATATSSSSSSAAATVIKHVTSSSRVKSKTNSNHDDTDPDDGSATSNHNSNRTRTRTRGYGRDIHHLLLHLESLSLWPSELLSLVIDYISSSRLLIYGSDHTRNKIHFWSIDCNAITASGVPSCDDWQYHGIQHDAPGGAIYIIDNINHRLIHTGNTIIISYHLSLHSLLNTCFVWYERWWLSRRVQKWC